MKLRLSDYQDNTYEDTDGSCELCMWTGMMDHPTYEFTDSYGGVHTVDGWYSDWGHMNVYDVNLPVFTTWLHDAEFKELEEVVEYLNADYCDDDRQWEKYLHNIIVGAEFCRDAEELNASLDWALKTDTLSS
jgi:hypothetical protein